MIPILACIPDDTKARDKISIVAGRPCVIYHDSIPDRCSQCGCKVWVGPQQQRFQGAQILCLPCAVPIAAGHAILSNGESPLPVMIASDL